MIRTLLLVGIGGATGSIFRYLTGILVNKYYSNHFPFATLTVNIIGCFIIGLIMGASEKQQLVSTDLKLLLITGFCGGYTTFSTFAYENMNLMQTNNSITAIIYIASSVLLGLLAVWAGLLVTR